MTNLNTFLIILAIGYLNFFNKFNSNFNKNMLRSSRFYSTKDNSTNDDVIDINSTFGTDIPDVNFDEVYNSKEKLNSIKLNLVNLILPQKIKKHKKKLTGKRNFKNIYIFFVSILLHPCHPSRINRNRMIII